MGLLKKIFRKATEFIVKKKIFNKLPFNPWIALAVFAVGWLYFS